MKLFIDSADPKKIADRAATGLINGVTTNPSTGRICDNVGLKTKILVASIRHIMPVRESALAGAGAKLKAA